MTRKSPLKPYEIAKMTGTHSPSPLQRTTSTPKPMLAKSEHISSTANTNNANNEILKINQHNNSNNSVYNSNTNLNSHGSSLTSTKPELPPRDSSISSYRPIARSSWERPRNSMQVFTVKKHESFSKHCEYQKVKRNILFFSGWLGRYYDDDRYGGYYGGYGGYGRDYWRYQQFISTQNDQLKNSLH
jgi:hypothetical protein